MAYTKRTVVYFAYCIMLQFLVFVLRMAALINQYLLLWQRKKIYGLQDKNANTNCLRAFCETGKNFIF